MSESPEKRMERVRKRHPRMFYLCLTHGALIRKTEYPSGGVFERTHEGGVRCYPYSAKTLERTIVGSSSLLASRNYLLLAELLQMLSIIKQRHIFCTSS